MSDVREVHGSRMIAIFAHISAAILALFLGAISPAAWSCPVDQVCRHQIVYGDRVFDFLERRGGQNLESLEQIIVVVHGLQGSAKNALKVGVAVAKELASDKASLVLAPEFLEIAPRVHESSVRLFWWGRSNWRGGDLSYEKNTVRVSSFTILDDLLQRYLSQDQMPRLKTVIILGHSAGGQYVQRYAIGTDIDKKFPSIQFVFGVANPSTYLYLNSQRPILGAEGGFSVPTESGCQWNAGHFGLESRNDYFLNIPIDDLRRSYLNRAVIYALGMSDNDPNHFQLSKSICAQLQGAHRLERGENYVRHLDTFFPGHRHTLIRVKGVGHNASKMFLSKEFVQQLSIVVRPSGALMSKD